MSEDLLVRHLTTAAYTAMQGAAPPLIVAMVVGFFVAMFQAVTQIQDQSLPLTLKILAVGSVFLLFGSVLSQPILAFAHEAFRIFPMVTR